MDKWAVGRRFPLFLLFLQEIISEPIRFLAEIQGRRRLGDRKTATWPAVFLCFRK
jgi:hypothetical protein